MALVSFALKSKKINFFALFFGQFFPRLIQCATPNFGPSGSLDVTSSLCVVFANIFVEAVVLTLWTFYLLAAPALVAALLWDLLPPAVAALRRRYLRRLLLLLKKAVKRAGCSNEAMVAEVLANVDLVSYEVALYVHYVGEIEIREVVCF